MQIKSRVLAADVLNLSFKTSSVIKLIGLSAVMVTGLSFAAPPENNDEVLRQQQRERVLQEQLDKKPDVRLEAPKAAEVERIPHDETPCFKIDRIALTGNASDKFTWALKAADLKDDPAVGQCLGTQGINIVMKRVQNAIIARGFVTTRVLAAPQDLKSGALTLSLLVGRIHAIRFTPDTSSRATSWNAIPAKSGDILNLRDIEQGLENFKRVPTADADIQITPAAGDDAHVGESDLVIAWKQRTPPLRISLSADDSGVKPSGRYQGSITLSGDDLLTLNDLFYVSLNHDLAGGNSNDYGTKGYALHYSLPVGYWQLAVNNSEYKYHQTIAGTNQTFISSGESGNSDVRLSRVVWRDATRKITLGSRAWLRTSQSFIDDTEIAVQHRRMAGWQLDAGDREFIGSATLDVNLAYKRGTGALDALPAPEEASGTGTSRLKLWLADAQLNVPFALGGQHLRYNLATRAQWNDTPLVPQDRFAIGGRYTVRGFDGEQLLSAERGWLIRNDIGWMPGNSNQELYLGADYGQVGGQSSGLLLGKQLAGAVLGLRGVFQGINYDVFAGQPIHKPEGFKTAHTTAGFNLGWTY